MGFVVYSRRGCHLCEVLIEGLLEELAGRQDPEVRDIDTNAEWRAAFNTRVPVLEYEGEWICDYELDPAARQRVRDILKAQSPTFPAGTRAGQ